jgi:hypothetical protein
VQSSVSITFHVSGDGSRLGRRHLPLRSEQGGERNIEKKSRHENRSIKVLGKCAVGPVRVSICTFAKQDLPLLVHLAT